MATTKCQSCPAEISDYWTLCNECREKRAAKHRAESRNNNPGDVLGYFR